MAISFTKSIIDRLNRELADLQSNSTSAKNKKEKALAKINQLQRDIKISNSPSDLSSKMTRINKLNEEIKTLNQLQADLTKQFLVKSAALKQQLAKEKQQAAPNKENPLL